VGVGHNFPAGYLDLDEAWLEVTVAGGDGRPLLENGVSTDPAAPVPDNAHVYGALRLDGRGRQILRHNLADQVTTAYQRAIPAGGADVARYRLLIPALARSSRAGAPAIRISARLMYRAVRPDYARWALAGAAPPVTTLAEAEVTVPLSRSAGAPDEDAASRRLAAERFVTYGRALLAPAEKPDIGGAMQAFHAAAELVPDRPEPWIGLGRAFLREPDLTLAAQNFDRALRCAPGSPAASAELSVVYNKQGQPQRAIDALGPLISRFPEDAALRYDLGLALFRAGRYQGAAEAFRGALAIDPDDYAAHFELKRCYEVVRNVPEARREEAVTRYMAEDRAAARLVPPFLASHPAPALRAEPFPIHELRRL
jgi:tetratricopeptide (TPR) repeat protein